jgi:hypothetical protein
MFCRVGQTIVLCGLSAPLERRALCVGAGRSGSYRHSRVLK